MQVTQVALRPTQASDAAGRPALTPELLAASGARYSRNNDGLEAILSKIDPEDLDKSVDSIFRMIDYGHQSIADMVPVAIFIDEISIFLAYLVWTWCPTAGGQESSTRYIKLNKEGLVPPDSFGIPSSEASAWYSFMERCFEGYSTALTKWEEIGLKHPELTRIPKSLLADRSDKSRKAIARIRRNYAFDRARYFLPIAAKTNMMMVMSARGWVQLCQHLLSHWSPEAVSLGMAIRDELALSAPRMVKHAETKHSFQRGLHQELVLLKRKARLVGSRLGEAECRADVQVFPPRDIEERDLVNSLRWYDNRYAYVDSPSRRTAVRFSWTAVSIAEVRDLNRHRTGQKYCELVPVGFYCAEDQAPEESSPVKQIRTLGDRATQSAVMRFEDGRPDAVAWLLLGSQLRFEHTTTLDKFIYEATLRTGPGAHYRYAQHLRDAVANIGIDYPSLSEAIPLGLNEPE